MTLNEVKTFVVGTIKQAFINKKTLDKFDDSTGTLKYDGQKINNFPVFVADDAPVGNIIAFMGNSAPQDYLVCDGTEYNIADYPLLAQHILDEFGSYNYFGGDGTVTFAVPDLRGEFLRGTGTATRDTGSGAEVGEHQEPTQHAWICKDDNNHVFINGGSGQNVYAQNTDKFAKLNNTIGFTIGNTNYTTWSASGNTHYTSRPTNTSVLYCIKYQITQNNISKDIVNYSLDEQCIGSWYNGKPLYEKTFTLITPTSLLPTIILNMTDLNIDAITSLNGTIKKGDDGYVLINFYYSEDNYVCTYTISKDIYISIGHNSYSGKPCVITVQYTKTTDTENSFTPDMLSNISTLNTIASDEEVNEVIGGI
jgi:microcystin-dependent protein